MAAYRKNLEYTQKLQKQALNKRFKPRGYSLSEEI